MKKIYVTKPFLPPVKEYQKYVGRIWKSGRLANEGPLVIKLENKIKKYLRTSNLHFVTNGTIALQLALNALDITGGEVITTPFTAVATVSSILWEKCKPVFVDIERDTFCVDADNIEKAITKKTKAIMAVHVYGLPCNIKKIEAIAKKHDLKVIYDGAHAFGAKYGGKSLLSFGDVSVCSFHATKIFQTAEGGCIIAKEKEVSDKLELMKKFGQNGDKYQILGINARASEFQAALGLASFEHIGEIIRARKNISEAYDAALKGIVERPRIPKNLEYNYAFHPVIFKNKDEMLRVSRALNRENIFPRRYFYPPLNTLPFLKSKKRFPVTEDMSSSVLCLPLYFGLAKKDVARICAVIKKCLGSGR